MTALDVRARVANMKEAGAILGLSVYVSHRELERYAEEVAK